MPRTDSKAAKPSLRERLRDRWKEGIRHKVTPLGAMMLVLLATSGLLSFATSQNVFFLLFSLLIASILISSFVNRLMLAGLDLRLDLPPHAMAGEPVNCALVVENRKSLLPSFALEITAPVDRKFHLPIVPAAGRVTLPVDVVWAHRGIPEPVVVQLSTRFPFGFSVRRARVHVRILQPLYPSIREKPGYRAIFDQLQARSSAGRTAQEAEFSHLREYAAGDDWRRIAWGKSAASTNWIVREQHSGGTGNLHIWLDLSSPEFELLVELTAYLVWELQFRGVRYQFSSSQMHQDVYDREDAYTILRKLSQVAPDGTTSPPHDTHYSVLSFHPGYLSLPADTPAGKASSRPN